MRRMNAGGSAIGQMKNSSIEKSFNYKKIYNLFSIIVQYYVCWYMLHIKKVMIFVMKSTFYELILSHIIYSFV